MATRRAAVLLRRTLPRPLPAGRDLLASRLPCSLSQIGVLPQLAPLLPFPPRLFRDPFRISGRPFSSAASSSNIVLLHSGDEVTSALKKAEEDKLPAVFYFTAAWCGPCRVIAPLFEQLSSKYSHVSTYKIDIDQEGLESILSNLRIYSVPTFHFFHEGKKATEVVGADVERLKDTMDDLYNETQ